MPSKSTKPIRNCLEKLIEEVRTTSFVSGYQATDAECLGLVLARYFTWDGLQVLKTAYAALEDSNYHKENEQIAKLIKQVEKEAL